MSTENEASRRNICFHLQEGFFTHCKAGVEYKTLETERWRAPCYGENPSGCSKYQAYTQEQYEAARAEIRGMLDRMKSDWGSPEEEEP